MKNLCLQLGRLAVLAVLMLLPAPHQAHAGYVYHASSYYDDLEDHYEHDQLMRDTIAQGMPS